MGVVVVGDWGGAVRRGKDEKEREANGVCVCVCVCVY